MLTLFEDFAGGLDVCPSWMVNLPGLTAFGVVEALHTAVCDPQIIASQFSLHISHKISFQWLLHLLHVLVGQKPRAERAPTRAVYALAMIFCVSLLVEDLFGPLLLAMALLLYWPK